MTLAMINTYWFNVICILPDFMTNYKNRAHPTTGADAETMWPANGNKPVIEERWWTHNKKAQSTIKKWLRECYYTKNWFLSQFFIIRIGQTDRVDAGVLASVETDYDKITYSFTKQ